MPKPGGTIYAIGMEGTALIKIGSTSGTPAQRIHQLQAGHPFAMHIVAAVSVPTDVQRIEKQVHRFLAHERRRGEWFAMTLDEDALTALVIRAMQYVQDEERPPRTPRHRPSPLLGMAIKKARIEQGVSQQALETLTGIDFRHLSAIERGDIDPRWSTVLKLAHALDPPS